MWFAQPDTKRNRAAVLEQRSGTGKWRKSIQSAGVEVRTVLEFLWAQNAVHRDVDLMHALQALEPAW